MSAKRARTDGSEDEARGAGSQGEQPCWIDCLGTELLELVAAQLWTAADICIFARVSRRFAQAAESDYVWLLAQHRDGGSKCEGETYRGALKRRAVQCHAMEAWVQYLWVSRWRRRRRR
mmetsp:Transcript_49677/g.113749  ORF Transcript_49677/g.113749 Transcript_49677/m.113749 type:complete len:119 (+) Transcript_49677:116-472(+)